MGKVIMTEYGQLTGKELDGITEYLGIPFAKPPVGDLAFKHPERPEPWEGIFSAVQGSPNPIQQLAEYTPVYIDQDCLYLNIYVPEDIPENAPVMVWIYGGAYSGGGAGAKAKDSPEMEYDMAYFAKETKTIIVTFNYRVCLHGFLYLEFLDPSFETNNGLCDQIMALQYVHDNIAAFGGDPGNVTVFGQSSGGGSIIALLAMDSAVGLFQKCIVQSPVSEHFFTIEEAKKNTLLFFKYAGVDKEHPETVYDLSPDVISKAADSYTKARFKSGDIRCTFSPVIDGKTIKEKPLEACRDKNVIMLSGNTKEEIAVSKGIGGLISPLIAKYLHIKVEKGPEKMNVRVAAAMTDHLYKRPMIEMLEKGYAGEAYRYLYDYVPVQAERAGLGCFHASELPVMFTDRATGEITEDPETVRTGKQLRSIWSRFAYTGDPGWESWKIKGYTQILPKR